MKISVVIVTYNSRQYLPDFMESILAQSYFQENEETPDIFVVDNASYDGTAKYINDFYAQVKLLRNARNIGLTRAWNQGIKLTRGEYILIMNPDLIMDKNFISQAVSAMESDEKVASVGGKLYRLRIEKDGELNVLEKTDILDNCGLVAFKNWRFIDRGAGEKDNKQYDRQEEVIGISGTLVLYRRKALEKIMFNDEFFDEDFFMYKEDIDMALRLRLNGWKALYNPLAVAYHYRRAKSLGHKINHWQTARCRLKKEKLVNYYSYRNHWLMLYKNSSAANLSCHWSYILWYELKKFIYVFFMENKNLRNSLGDFWRLRKIMKQKKAANMSLKEITGPAMEKWFF